MTETSTPRVVGGKARTVVGMQRRLALLESPLPLTIIETTPGAGTRTLLREWARRAEPTDCRVLIEADHVEAATTDMLRFVASTVFRDRSGADGGAAMPVGDDTADIAASLVAVLRRDSRTVTIAVVAADFLSSEAFSASAGLLILRDRVRLILAGFDLTPHLVEARDRQISFNRLVDRDLCLDDHELSMVLR